MPIKIPQRTETSIESAFVRKVKKTMPRWRTRKLNGLGNRDWPDELCVSDFGVSVYIEFKRPGEEPTETQQDMIDWLRRCGHSVHVCHSVTAAIDVLKLIESES